MMLEILEYSFMQRALVAGAIVGLLCSLLGVFVVLRGLGFIGAGISHAAFGGVALALLLGVPALLGAFVFCCGVALVIGSTSRLGQIREDTAIGIFFAASMALGVLLLGVRQDPSVDLMSYLFGGILTISDYDLYVSLVLGLAAIACVFLFYNHFVAVAFDEQLAALSGMPAKAISNLLLVLLSLAVVSSMSLVGIILVSALIITPAATALQLARDIDRVMLFSGIIGVVVTETGLIASFYLNTAPGPTIVLLSTMIFFIAALRKQKLKRKS